MSKNKYTVKATLWRWPGDGGWHFVTLHKEIFAAIRATHPKGLIRIEAKIGKSVWHTSLLPHTRSGEYLIAIKKMIRYEEGLMEGDEVTISFKII